MREHCQVRSCSWSKSPKRCSAEVMPGEFVLVDDDNDVIVLDFPDSVRWKSSGASRSQRKSPSQGVINIDDDDDDDENNDGAHNVPQPGNNSSRSNPAAYFQTSPEVDDDECRVIQEKCSAFRFSKCKQTFSSKGPSRNRFGLGSESESDWSESDCSDCEILEGTYIDVREQWEKASLRRKRKAGKDNISSGLPKEASPPGPHFDANPSVRFENGTKPHAQASSFFTPQSSDKRKENSSFFATGDGKFHAAPFDTAMKEDNHANVSLFNEEISQGPSLQSNMDRQFNAEFCSSNCDQQCSNFSQDDDFRSGLNHQKGDLQGKYFSLSKKKQPAEVQSQHEEPASPSPENNCLHESTCQTGLKENEKQPAEMQVEQEGSSPLSAQTNHSQECVRQTSFKEGEGQLDKMALTPSTSGHIPGVDGAPIENDIINDRAKLKETNEYKKAAEEEWEARQLQLRIQAEEVQRLRKKRKLESMRRLEMERRQKERVEEMRETQKKDEENLNMKEQIRAEVIKSLKRLEIVCFDMAALLRGLGIPVGGGAFPSSNEVHAAYKRALLKFHPDRASRGDIREQVEAEEKFKLIARMKEKFLSSSCR